MSTFRLEINMGNAAFADRGWFVEAAEILRKAADRVEDARDEGVLYDSSGNRVGFFEAKLIDSE